MTGYLVLALFVLFCIAAWPRNPADRNCRCGCGHKRARHH